MLDENKWNIRKKKKFSFLEFQFLEHNALFFLGNEREFNIETKEFLEISIIIFYSIWNAIFFSLSQFLSFIIIYKFQKLLLELIIWSD